MTNATGGPPRVRSWLADRFDLESRTHTGVVVLRQRVPVRRQRARAFARLVGARPSQRASDRMERRIHDDAAGACSTRAHSMSTRSSCGTSGRAKPGHDDIAAPGGQRQRRHVRQGHRQVQRVRPARPSPRKDRRQSPGLPARSAVACNVPCRTRHRAPCGRTPAGAARAPPSARRPSASCGRTADTSAPMPRRRRKERSRAWRDRWSFSYQLSAAAISLVPRNPSSPAADSETRAAMR